MDHSRLSPSSAWRWLTCPASAVKNAEDESGEAAEKGTKLHTIASDRLNCSISSHELMEWLMSLEEDDKHTMLDLLDAYTSFVKSMPGVRYVERNLLSKIIDDHGGTIDALAVSPQRLHIVDLKTGHRPVQATMNKQMMCYLNLAREHFGDREHYFATIISRSGIDTTSFTREQLDMFQMQVFDASNDDTIRAGSHCVSPFPCPLLEKCMTAQGYALEVAHRDFSKLIDRKEALLTEDDLVAIDQILAAADVIGKLEKVFRDKLRNHLLAGGQSETHRLAKPNNMRSWADETAVSAILPEILKNQDKDPNMVYDLKSVAQVEKIIGTKALAELNLVKLTPGRPKLVSSSSNSAPFDWQSDFDSFPIEEV